MDDFASIAALLFFFFLTVIFSPKKKPRGTGLPLPKRGKPGRPRESEPTLPPPMPRPWEESKREDGQEKTSPLGFKIPPLRGAPQTDRTVATSPAPGTEPLPQPAASGRVLTNRDAQADADGVIREPGVLASELQERLRERAADLARQTAYETQRRLEETATRAREAAAYAKDAKLPAAQPPTPRLRLTPQTAREAIVLAEILGRPKAHRHK